MTEAASGALAVVENHHEIFDLADEDQIVAELQGRVTDKYVYELKGMRGEDGKPIVGLSYAGTNWACREYAKRGEIIRVDKNAIDYQVDPTNDQYVLITVIAQRFALNMETGKEIPLDTAPGLKRQWTKMKRGVWENSVKVRDEIVDDPFFWEKGLSKATRNAKQALIPTDIVKELIAKALEQKNNPSARPAAAAPAGKGGQRPPAQNRGAAPPQGPASQASPAPAPPGAAGAPPPGGGQQASAPAGGAASPKPGATQTKDSLVQMFDVVLKAALKTQDVPVARAALKKLLGTDKITDLSEADLRKYGKILQGVPQGIFKIAEDGTHITDKDGNVVCGAKPATPPPAADAAPAAAPGAPAEGADKTYF